MSTPLYKALKSSTNNGAGGFSTYVLPSASQDISQAYQNDNFTMNFSKFALLNLDLSKMNLQNNPEFNTESTQTITDVGALLIQNLRNYVANQEVTIMDSLLNNNTPFYDPSIIRTPSERIFWKWLRKTGLIEFEPAVPNVDYIDGQDFAVDTTLPNDFFKEYLWKERSVTPFTINNIIQETFDNSVIDPFDNIGKNIYQITVSTTSNIKPNDRVSIISTGNVGIGFNGSMGFSVYSIATNTFNNTVSDKNNVIYILSNTQINWNNFASATLTLQYTKVVQYLGEISSVNNVQNTDNSYTEINAYIPNQNGATPDILFRLRSDKNYSPSLQYPILPSQQQPEIIGAEQLNSPINVRPSDYVGNQYAIFDVDQTYQNSNGLPDRKTGDFFGVLDTNRNDSRVISAPYVYPEFDGSKLDGITLDYDTSHYVKMNLPNQKSKDFDTFDSLGFNNLPPNDFNFNVILWYYQVEDLSVLNQSVTSTNTTSGIVNTVNGSTTTTTTTITVTNQNNSNVNQDASLAMNLYGITFLNPINPATNNMNTLPKLVSNGKQDGLSYTFSLNLNFNISSENVIETYDPNKIYSQFSFDLYNNVMRKVSVTNEAYMNVITQVVNMSQDILNLKTLIYTKTDINSINASISSLYTLLNTYKRNQISDSESIVVSLNESTSPPTLQLTSIDARYGTSVKYPVGLLYSNQTNTVTNNKVTVPLGKDFLINVINDDTTNVVLDGNLNIVLSNDLAYKQTCEIKIYAKNALYNKKLNISILTSLVNNVDSIKGYPLLSNINLPIDTNLNPNTTYQNIGERWNNFPEIFPTTIGMKKIAGSYYLVVGIDAMKINAFNTGDVIYLENFQLVLTNITTPIITDISGQYTIVGAITNNELSFQIDDVNFIALYKQMSLTNTSPTIYLTSDNITQPALIRYNTGWYISITATDKSPVNISDNYLIQMRPLRKEEMKLK